jgi:2-polyprenyl-3-methyl-5-hydroxy-6-metoxy-1,4-benzoquinol methylase
MTADDQTSFAYAKNATSYSEDWLNQPVPTDIYQLIQKHFIQNGRTADIGCGNGRDANWMQQNGLQVSGFDSSTELLKIARELYPKVQFKKSTLPSLIEITDQFENVFCETVIMHLPKPQIALALENLKRIMKTNGVMYLSWRVTESQDARHQDGRLYSAFDSEFILNQFESTQVMHFEDIVSLSSQKRVCRLIWRKK